MPRPDKLAVHVFEVDEDVDKDEVGKNTPYTRLLNTGEACTKNVRRYDDDIFLSQWFGDLQRHGKEIKGGVNGKCCHQLSGTQDSSLPPILF